MEIPSALYAVAAYDKNDDAMQAWTEFYYKDLPKAGYVANKLQGYSFEYYPNGENGNYELWMSVVKSSL